MAETQKIAWHHFKFRVPADWEVTSYSVEDRIGRLEFSTRKGFQAMIGWQPCRRAPDIHTTMLSFLEKRVSKPRSGGRMSTADLRTKKGGSFLLGYCDEEQPCQAIRYLEEPKKILTWIFSSSRRDLVENVWPSILESFEPNDGESREYAVYGLDIMLPMEFLLEDMAVLSGNVMMAFESKGRLRATFRRWGMPEVVLTGRTLEEFYPAFLRVQGCFVKNVEKTSVFGMEAVKVRYEQRGEHKMERFMGRYWKDGEAYLWHNKEEKRLYAFEQIGPDKGPLLTMEEVFTAPPPAAASRN